MCFRQTTLFLLDNSTSCHVRLLSRCKLCIICTAYNTVQWVQLVLCTLLSLLLNISVKCISQMHFSSQEAFQLVCATSLSPERQSIIQTHPAFSISIHPSLFDCWKVPTDFKLAPIVRFNCISQLQCLSQLHSVCWFKRTATTFLANWLPHAPWRHATLTPPHQMPLSDN